MVSTAELAQQMYAVWRAREDLVEPLPPEMVDYLDNEYKRKRGLSPASRPRPRWECLSPGHQQVWRAVAEEAARTLADAMGAAG